MSPAAVTLRRADADPHSRDSRLMFAWRNDPQSRAMSRHRDEISWPTHVAWYEGAARDPLRHLFIAEVAEGKRQEPAGCVRFDVQAANIAEISLHLAPERRGQGLGRAMLEAAIREAFEQLGFARLLASVRLENEPSHRLFAALGFEETMRDSEFTQYSRERQR